MANLVNSGGKLQESAASGLEVFGSWWHRVTCLSKYKSHDCDEIVAKKFIAIKKATKFAQWTCWWHYCLNLPPSAVDSHVFDP